MTAAGLKALQVSGEISMDTLICQKGTESWVPFSQIFPASLSVHAVPIPVIYRTATPAPVPTKKPKPEVNLKAVNGCAGCLGIIAFVLIWIGITVAFNTTYNQTDYSKEVVANPKLPKRDVFHISSPDEERAYQQKRLDAQFKDVWTQKQVAKTEGEKMQDFVIGFLFVGVAVALLIAAVKLLKRAHT